MNKISLLAGALLCVAGTPTLVQAQGGTPILPSQMDRSLVRPGARALGLGGTVLFGQNGSASATFNPAAIINNTRLGVGIETLGRTENLDVQDVQDIIDSVTELNDAVDDNTFPQDEFDTLFNLARAKNNQLLEARVSAGIGINAPRISKKFAVGILAQGEAMTNVRVVAQDTQPNRRLQAGGGALSLTSVGIPVATQLDMTGTDYGTLGVSLKYLRADYLAASFDANETGGGSVDGTTFDHADDAKFDLDLGYISPSLVKNQPYDVRAAVSVRHLLSPSFNLVSTGERDNGSGSTATVNIDGSFKQKTMFDTGVSFRSSLMKLSAFGEVHNITEENGGKRTFHLGAQYDLTRGIALRAGLDDDEPTLGVGLNFGGFFLDAAACTDPKKRLALGLGYGF